MTLLCYKFKICGCIAAELYCNVNISPCFSVCEAVICVLRLIRLITDNYIEVIGKV